MSPQGLNERPVGDGEVIDRHRDGNNRIDTVVWRMIDAERNGVQPMSWVGVGDTAS
jgi:hypothetical protein